MSVLALFIDFGNRLTAGRQPRTIHGNVFAALADTIAYRRAYFTVSRLPRHLIVDMKLDPDDLKRSFRASWRAAEASPPETPAAAASRETARAGMTPATMGESCAC